MAVGGPAPDDRPADPVDPAGPDGEAAGEPDDGPDTGPDTGPDDGLAAEPAGRAPAIRPFLLTAGRVSGDGAAPPLPLEAQIVSTAAGLAALRSLTFEHHDIVAACRRPQSLAELAAELRLHLNVVRVLAGDLCAAGHLAIHRPDAGTVHDVSVLRRVIDGLRAVPDSGGTLRSSG